MGPVGLVVVGVVVRAGICFPGRAASSDHVGPGARVSRPADPSTHPSRLGHAHPQSRGPFGPRPIVWGGPDRAAARKPEGESETGSQERVAGPSGVLTLATGPAAGEEEPGRPCLASRRPGRRTDTGPPRPSGCFPNLWRRTILPPDPRGTQERQDVTKTK